MKCKTSYGERDLFLMDRKKGIRYGRDSRGGGILHRRNGQNFPQKKDKRKRQGGVRMHGREVKGRGGTIEEREKNPSKTGRRE